MQIKNSVEKSNKYMVGFDLGDRDAQLSYCSTQQPEAETVPAVEGTKRYNIPTALAKRKGANHWVYGREALRLAEEGEGTLVENLFSGALADRKVVIEGVSYDVLTLLALFVKKCFGLFNAIAPLYKIGVLTFTAGESGARVVEVMRRVVDTLGFINAKVYFQSHEESYYCYLLHQPPEFRLSGSAILEFEEELRVYLLEWNRRTAPVVSFVESLRFPECRLPLWEENGTLKNRQMEELDEHFLDCVEGILKDRNIGSVFLVGNGFTGDWADRSLQYLCRGRRVFQGNNLYSRGAAFGAFERLCPTKEGREHIFLGKEKLRANVGLQAVREGKEAYVALLDAGTNWYDAICEKEFYLESGNSYQVALTPLTNVSSEGDADGKYPVRYEEIELPELPERPAGATRLRVTMTMADEETLHVKTEDLGLGAIFPSSGMMWELEIGLQSNTDRG